jgi:hypothetical protein
VGSTLHLQTIILQTIRALASNKIYTTIWACKSDRVNLGKQFQKSFPKESTTRANEPLQLVHVDV